MRLRGGGPHEGQPAIVAGTDPSLASAAAILLHGRGATAESILTVAQALDIDGVAWVAPQAAERAWYPHRFIEPLSRNEPWLSSALAGVGSLLDELAALGLPPERTILAGFSQGACLALEYAIRHPRRYGGLAGLSGGLIGPPGTEWPTPAALAGTPVFLGCSDVDAHIPAARVLETAEVFRRSGAAVTDILYEGMGHTVNDDELMRVRAMFQALPART